LHRNWILKHITEEKIEGRLLVTSRQRRRISSYWMSLQKLECTGKRKHYIELCGELALEEAMDLMSSRPQNE
jgi:hypothetical protein